MRCWLPLAAVLLAGPVYADALMRPVAKGGDWAAAERAPTKGAPANVCLAIDATVGMAFQADATGTVLEVQNPHWDLPATSDWTIKITVGSDVRVLPVTSNTTNIVAANITPAVLSALLDEMEKAPSMRVVVGRTTPLTVSLAGSAVVLNAFRTCAMRIG